MMPKINDAKERLWTISQLDAQDRRALRALDDGFTIDSNVVASVEGEMQIEIVRAADDGGAHFGSRLNFPAAKNSSSRT